MGNYLQTQARVRKTHAEAALIEGEARKAHAEAAEQEMRNSLKWVTGGKWTCPHLSPPPHLSPSSNE
jgi:hypothetical protein